ncbi:hypothetical protein NGRA_2792 [Nosema granulosis]|uniref:Uncharacterized protein n=1 Tax=Nosema granulosis TaxID=83296 RepID=A0A9P6GWE7_9MICR|nr:hypothetical protein NGRA_2792 [Nosema granulosis]
MLLDEVLYLRDNEGLHKKVFHADQSELMGHDAILFHKQHHFVMNRFEAKYNDYFFKIHRDIIRKVVSECVTCIQAQPLKTKEKLVHIIASRPMERIQIDLIDTRRYRDSNGMTAWILTAIDVYSKFAWAFPLDRKQVRRFVRT